jgi:hypothetical protein
MRISVTVLWIAFAGYQLVLQIRSGWLRYQQSYAHPPRPLLGGAYEVESFRADGRDVPPLITERTRWRRVGARCRWRTIRGAATGQTTPRTPIRLR